ncbi:MAG: prolyl oligopeptidase family serine peptidase [Candidatus Cyclobacteriaceae bacterium M3_2C_046]
MKYLVEKKSWTGLNYLLYKPDFADEQIPFLLYLHGAGERGNDLNKLLTYGPPKIIEASGSFPMLMVAPQCPSFSYWDPDLLIELVRETEEQYEVDWRRIYLSGVSMGGYATWKLALLHANVFAAIAPICGGGNPELVYRIKDVPTWVFHGAEDKIVPLQESAIMVDRLRLIGGNVKFTVYPGVGHDSWIPAYEKEPLFDWLLQQRRPE